MNRNDVSSCEMRVCNSSVQGRADGMAFAYEYRLGWVGLGWAEVG